MGGSSHSLPRSHVGRSIQPAWQIGAALKRTSAASIRVRAPTSRREARGRAGGRARRAAGGGALPLARPSPGGSHAPRRALAAARARLQPRDLAPSRPRTGGGLAARAGRGSGASREWRTLVAGAAPGPERAPLPPEPRTPGRRLAGEAAAAETVRTAPCASREVSKVGVRGGSGCGSGARCWSLAPARNGRSPRSAPTSGARGGAGPGAAGRRAGEPGPLHRALRGETAPRSRPSEGRAEGMERSPGRRRRALNPGPGKGSPEFRARRGRRCGAGSGRRADAAGAPFPGSGLCVRC